ncbi:MAG: FMN-binding protein, partial [Fibrobacteres bacterium]|nr:FMN-binding protein [Fibrobacterota bacterium]
MSIIRFIITMALLCGAAAGFLAFVNSKTSKIIEANKQKEALKAVMDRVIKGQFTDVSISSNPDSICVYKKVKDRETGVEKTVRFIDAKNGQGRTVVQVVENVSTIGYGGPISILVGIDSTGRIIGSTVLSHTETPGLGDQLLDDWFLKQFIGRTADSGDIKITKFGGNIES